MRLLNFCSNFFGGRGCAKSRGNFVCRMTCTQVSMMVTWQEWWRGQEYLGMFSLNCILIFNYLFIGIWHCLNLEVLLVTQHVWLAVFNFGAIFFNTIQCITLLGPCITDLNCALVCSCSIWLLNRIQMVLSKKCENGHMRSFLHS